MATTRPVVGADAVVVGGTVAGLTTALTLAEQGRRVLLVDPGEPGDLAARGLGMGTVARGSAALRLAQAHGPKAATRHLREQAAAIAAAAGLAERAGVAVERPQGWDAAIDGHLAFQLRQEALALRLAGITVEFTDLQPFATDIRPAAVVPGQLRVDPADYAAGLLRLARAAGVELRRGTRPVRYGPGRVDVAGEREERLAAPLIVDTLGTAPAPGAGRLLDAGRRVRVGWAPVIVAAPLPRREVAADLLCALVDTPASLVDASPARTVIVGRPGERAHAAAATARLDSWARRYLGAAPTRAGLVAVESEPDGLPVIGELAPGLWTARGFGLWELAAATAAARRIAGDWTEPPVGTALRAPAVAGRAARVSKGRWAPPLWGIARILARRALDRDVSRR